MPMVTVLFQNDVLNTKIDKKYNAGFDISETLRSKSLLTVSRMSEENWLTVNPPICKM